jgi:tripartite-type tricarboxylate transporter receptor subunit TctC
MIQRPHVFKWMSALIVGLAAAGALQAQSQAYPSKPIRVVLGYTVGGAADAAARPLMRVLETLLGQPIVIEARPGTAGGVAAEFISKTSPDGYTLYFADGGPFTTAPHLTKVGYHPLNSFTHIGHVCGNGSVLVVHPSSPFKSVADVVAAAKKEPDKWSYGTSGVAGPHHLSGELFKNFTGVNILHIPYKGGAPAMADLMGNQVPMLFSSQSPAVGPYNNGKIRALAVTSPKRSGAFPDVPTLDELGYKGFDSTGWFELAGPAGMAPEVVARLSQALLKAAEDKGLQEQLRQLGCDAEFLTPAQTLEKIKTDHAKWGKVIKEANIKAD